MGLLVSHGRSFAAAALSLGTSLTGCRRAAIFDEEISGCPHLWPKRPLLLSRRHWIALRETDHRLLQPLLQAYGSGSCRIRGDRQFFRDSGIPARSQRWN